MRDADIPPDRVCDPLGKRFPGLGRDPERTPMQWDASAQAGFSSNPHTWLPVTSDYPGVNVASESADSDSLLNWYRRLIALRRSNAALRGGRMVMLDDTNTRVLTFARVAADGTAVLVSLNMSPTRQTVSLALAPAGLRGGQLTTLLSSPAAIAAGGAERPLTLPPYAAWVAALR